MFGDEAKTPVDKKRTAISCMVTAGALALLFFVLKAPATKSAPGLVQFSGETIVRAAADGFVDEILVANGAEVEEGQVLVRMHNDDLKIEIEALVSKLEIATIEARIHRQLGEVALAGVKQETIKGLQSQLAEKHEQAARLELRSPMTGRVFQRNLEELNGRFLKRGSALMSVANQATKELVVSVDQSDLESIKLNLGGPARVLLPGQRIFQSKIERIDPRASEIPAEIRLCAAAGGPLPVKPKLDSGGDENESPYILLSPRFSVHVPIDGPVARTLYSGQRGSVFFSATDQSLGSYLYLATTQWLRNKIEMAVETTTL